MSLTVELTKEAVIVLARLRAEQDVRVAVEGAMVKVEGSRELSAVEKSPSDNIRNWPF